MSKEVTLIIISLLSIAFFCVIIRERKWEKLARLEKQKNMLLAIISHQLRTPVTTIQWYIEMLQHGDFGEMNEEQREPFERLTYSVSSIVQLVSKLLETSRIEHTGITQAPISLNVEEKVGQVLKSLEEKIDGKRHQVQVARSEAPIIARIDPLVLHAVLGVILENAIAYTPAQGKIRIAFENKRRTVVIIIQDTGPGLPPSQGQELFTKAFRREKEKLLLTAGGGIGLYLVQHLVEDIGGTVWFHSEEGKGTTFHVTLPKGKG